MVILSFLFPARVYPIRPVRQDKRKIAENFGGRRRTLDGIRLGQLCAVIQELRGDIIPSFPVAEAHIDVSAGQIIDVELRTRSE